MRIRGKEYILSAQNRSLQNWLLLNKRVQDIPFIVPVDTLPYFTSKRYFIQSVKRFDLVVPLSTDTDQ